MGLRGIVASMANPMVAANEQFQTDNRQRKTEEPPKMKLANHGREADRSPLSVVGFPLSVFHCRFSIEA